MPSCDPAGLAEQADIVADRAAGAEDGRPGDRDRHAGIRERTSVLETDAAVDLDLDALEPAPHELRAQPRDLADHARNEKLPAEAGIDRHEERDVDVGQDLV